MKFCTTCGKEIDPNAKFCTTCGTRIDQQDFFADQSEPGHAEAEDISLPSIGADFSQPEITEANVIYIDDPALEIEPEVKAEKVPRKPLSRGSKLGLVAGGVASAALIISAFYPWPTAVAISLTLDAPYGGVFNEDCSLTPDAIEAGASKVTLVDYGRDPETKGKHLDLNFKSLQGKCVGETTFWAEKRKDYEIYQSGEKKSDVTAAEVLEGSKSEVVKLAMYQRVSGVVVIKQTLQSCTKVNNVGIDCTVPSGTKIAADLHFNKMTCNGILGFSDIEKGAALSVNGISGSAKGRIKLGQGKAEIIDLKKGTLTCTFATELLRVGNDEKGYKVKLGDHPAAEFKTSDLKKSSWVFNYNIGS
jgi:hypothetical protein